MSRKTSLAVAASVALALGALPSAAAARHGAHQRHHASGRQAHAESTVVGTVASFADGVLTITQADGTTVSAKVTDATRIECAPTATMADHHGGGDHGQTGGQTESEPAEDQQATDPEDQQATGAAGQSGSASPAACDQTALVAGAVVTRARIRDAASGAYFKQIKLAV
jgi:hypothetical protein